jgi:hypothetical protein
MKNSRHGKSCQLIFSRRRILRADAGRWKVLATATFGTAPLDPSPANDEPTNSQQPTCWLWMMAQPATVQSPTRRPEVATVFGFSPGGYAARTLREWISGAHSSQHQVTLDYTGCLLIKIIDDIASRKYSFRHSVVLWSQSESCQQLSRPH